MSAHGYTEDQLVEQPAIGLFTTLGWQTVSALEETFGARLADQQEVLMHLADICMDVFAAESAVLRASAAANGSRGALHIAAARVFVNDAAMRIDASARQALAAMAEGDTLRMLLAALRRLIKVTPINTAALSPSASAHKNEKLTSCRTNW